MNKTKNDMLEKIINNKFSIPVSLLIGGTLGYTYWAQVGCLTGTCPMNASPLMNISTGGAIGYLIISVIKDVMKDRKEQKAK